MSEISKLTVEMHVGFAVLAGIVLGCIVGIWAVGTYDGIWGFLAGAVLFLVVMFTVSLIGGIIAVKRLQRRL